MVHEIDETPDGQVFIAMAYYEGQPLKKRIAAGLPSGEAAEIAKQIAQGLDHAHRHGVIHRDIKPGNVIITTEGVAKIIDFGLAKLPGVTATMGVAKGTPAYMSPEQAAGKEIDFRSDIFSLGVILYEMLAGALPFSGESQSAQLYAIVHEAPRPLHAVRPDVPDGLERIVNHALEKEREKRYASAGELGSDLADFQASLTVSATVAAKRKSLARRRIGWALVPFGNGDRRWLYQRNAPVRWARNHALPAISQLTAESNYIGAFRLARKAARHIPVGSQAGQGLGRNFHYGVDPIRPAGCHRRDQRILGSRGSVDPSGQDPAEGACPFAFPVEGCQVRLCDRLCSAAWRGPQN